jgi:hypothetical protein
MSFTHENGKETAKTFSAVDKALPGFMPRPGER